MLPITSTSRLILLATALLFSSCSILQSRVSESDVKQLIQESFSEARPSGGRLFSSSHAPITTDQANSAIGRAQLLLLQLPESPSTRRLQADIHIGSAGWSKAAEVLEALLEDRPYEWALNNDLGVVYLEMGREEAAYTFKALAQFQAAAQIDPAAPEPLFNLALAYRHLFLPAQERQAVQDYLVKHNDAWAAELQDSASDEVDFEQKFRDALIDLDLSQIDELIDGQIETCWGVILEYALQPSEAATSTEALLRVVARKLQERHGDETLSKMLAPLTSSSRRQIAAVRSLVRDGQAAYQSGDYERSLTSYEEAAQAMGSTDSPFDRAWIAINEADSLVRAGRSRRAVEILAIAVAESRREGMRWLLAKALAVYGADRNLSDNYLDMQVKLQESTEILDGIGFHVEAVRPTYYLAVHHYAAADPDASLNLIFRSFQFVESTDYINLNQLYWLTARNLHRQGDIETAAIFQQQAADHASDSGIPELIVFANTELAQLHQHLNEATLVQRHLEIAENASRRMQSQFQGTVVQLNRRLAQARIYLSQQPERVETLIKRNLTVLAQSQISGTHLHSQSLLVLAKAYDALGRTAQARGHFVSAIEVVERDDNYLQMESSRLAFNQERRDLYDSAVEFEYRQGDFQQAWNFAQRYRTKLFLELLQQSRSAGQVPAARLELENVQRLMPSDVQTLEYFALEDRLLVWVLSKDKFESRSVPVSRVELEDMVEQFLAQVASRGNVTRISQDLYTLLVGPVESLLDRDGPVAIVPDRSLHRLPFAALVSCAGAYLVQEHALMDTPSQGFFFANPSGAGGDSIVAFGSQRTNLPIRAELAELKDVYPSLDVYDGTSATKYLLFEAMRDARILHYAGHSAFDGGNALQAAILLDNNGTDTVTAYEIAEQQMPGNSIVVLSSCDSSVGNSKDGAGIRGLTSAFLIAGAGSVVGALWPVETTATADLMMQFHTRLEESQHCLLPTLSERRN